MRKEITTLEPSLLWKHFMNICSIPHPSKHEEKIVKSVQQFAIQMGLKYKTDELGNTVIFKPATKGMENRKTIVLQSHLDMVPQKNTGIQHDFEKDPIRPYAEDGWVKATDTTLGADNGIGAAAMLALLESKEAVHGPIEALFTIDEETGLTGAFGLKPDFITGDILLNLDTEEDGHFCIGCAGGINNSAVFKIKSESLTAEWNFYNLTVKGLLGGHSGVDIHLYRANANKILNRLIWLASKEINLRLASFEGGTVRNAIPREAVAIVAIAKEQEKTFEKIITAFLSEVKAEYAIADPDIQIVKEKIENQPVMISSDQKRLMNAIHGIPNGVFRMSDEVAGIVETSTNLSTVKTTKETAEVFCLTRSSVESSKMDLTNTLESIFVNAGADVTNEGSYPGWKPSANSPVLKLLKEVYKKTFNAEANVEVVHAGLECGIIGNVYPGMDMISFGPTIKHPHSPDEKVEIETVEKFWRLLLNSLKEIPVK